MKFHIKDTRAAHFFIIMPLSITENMIFITMVPPEGTVGLSAAADTERFWKIMR